MLLARRLHLEGACGGFDPGDLVRRATRFLIHRGPVTGEERWEEQAGYSPSTIAAIIAACVCAAAFATEADDQDGAAFLHEYADWLFSHISDWMVTNTGTLTEGVKRHFVRLNPTEPGMAARKGDVDRLEISLTSQSPGAPREFPAREIVDGGFLELVRHGILAADDPLVIDSLRVVDEHLKKETPLGAAWRRYNHDGYGQRADGRPYEKFGTGRAWPLLAGERGHYELAAGRDPSAVIRAMEKFGLSSGLVSEQVWDAPDLPAADLRCGYPTGTARPLAWAHSEYIKLLRSVDDGVPYDRFAEVAKSYLGAKKRRPPEFWTFRHPTPQMIAGHTLRICAEASFQLRFSTDAWQSSLNQDSTAAYGISFVDVPTASSQTEAIRFTMYWPGGERWEGRNFEVEML